MMTVKNMTLHSFKGSKNKTFSFSKLANKIVGENGAGKSTIATAYYWLFANKSVDLSGNPEVRPIGDDVGAPKVEVTLDMGGKEIKVSRTQTYKKSGDSYNVSNVYAINGIEYGKQSFDKKIKEYGFDADLFLTLSHPDYFLSKKQDDMRKTLFGMANRKSELEIAGMSDETKDVAALLRENKEYTASDLSALNKSALKKIIEEYGKNGEILRAEIKGLESAKVDVDIAELELQRNDLLQRISEARAVRDDLFKQAEVYENLSDGIIELKFAETDLLRKMNKEHAEKRKSIEEEISRKKDLRKQMLKEINDAELLISSKKNEILEAEHWLDDARKDWETERTCVFDENSLVCAYCGQEYTKERKEKIKREFEEQKRKRILEIETKGAAEKKYLELQKKILQERESERTKKKERKKELDVEIAYLEEQLLEIPESIDISETEEYKKIRAQIIEKEKAMEKMNNSADAKKRLNNELDSLQCKLSDCEKELYTAQKNVEIDEQIDELRKKGMKYEQKRANHEKILYQLDLVSKKKNEILTDEINKNFDIVRWKMFETLKNGEIKDCCIPTIDEKVLGESMNTSTEICAKLDILKGLQKFFGKYYPVFLDGAECLSEKTKAQISMPCQMFYLNVGECELTVNSMDNKNRLYYIDLSENKRL